MKEPLSIEEFIEKMRELIPYAIDIFLHGNCTTFALLLDSAYIGEVVHNLDHALFLYKGEYYDITGKVKVLNKSSFLVLNAYKKSRELSLRQNYY